MTIVKELIRASEGPDLSVSHKAKPEGVRSGDKVTYSIKVHNAGPSDATDAVRHPGPLDVDRHRIRDELPWR